MSTPTILYRARDRVAATASGVPRRSYPLAPGSVAPSNFFQKAYAFAQDFEQWMANFPPAPLNTPGNAAALGLGDANAILTSLSQPSDSKAGTGKFTGTFHIVPASWDDFVEQAVTFPGIRDTNYTGGVRDPKPWNVLTRQRRDYFVLDPDNILATAGVKDSGGSAIKLVNSKGAIPVMARTVFGFTIDGGATLLTTGEVTGLVKAGGIPGWYETVPNTETYQAWCAVVKAFNAALAGGGTQQWDDTHPPAWNGALPVSDTNGQWRFADSRLEEYAGNIIARVSEYVLAQ